MYRHKTLSPSGSHPSRPDPTRQESAFRRLRKRCSTASTKKRILVIDDDPDAVYLLRENLNQKEFDIIGARSGRDGLELARKHHPQAILLDIVMPGADGWQILHDLKEDPATCRYSGHPADDCG